MEIQEYGEKIKTDMAIDNITTSLDRGADTDSKVVNSVYGKTVSIAKKYHLYWFNDSCTFFKLNSMCNF